MDIKEKIKAVLGSKDYEVNVITTTDGSRTNGQCATWVTQLSMEPPLMAVCLAPERYTSEIVKKSKVLAVNVLAKDQADLVPHFGYRSGRDFNKFADIAYKTAVTGSPILNDVYAYYDCKVKDIFPGGDHEIFVCEIVDAGFGGGKEQLYYQWLVSKAKEA